MNYRYQVKHKAKMIRISEVARLHARSRQLCLTLCDLTDCNPPGSSIHEILQARILEWVAIPSSRGSSQTRDGTLISYIGMQVFYH